MRFLFQHGDRHRRRIRLPRRLTYRSWSEVPEPPELRRLLSADRPIVLQFPAAALPDGQREEKRAFIERLAAALPDCHVFNSGGDRNTTRVTLRERMPVAEVLREAPLMVEAARQSRAIATELVARLARHLDVPVSRFWERLLREDLPAESQHGPLDSEWDYRFHGLQCAFVNRRTGQSVDVELGFEKEFGALDPWFFVEFAETTPGLERVANHLWHDFSCARDALEVLEEHGYLRRVVGSLTDRTRLVVADRLHAPGGDPGPSAGQ